MSQENEIEAKKLRPTTDFLPSDGASCCASYRELTPDDVIQKGDQYLPAGFPLEDDANWKPVHETIGRTVREQLAREYNAAEKFRRECIKEESYRAALEYELSLAEKQVELLKLRVAEGGHEHVKPFGTDAWKRAERLRAVLRHNAESIHPESKP